MMEVDIPYGKDSISLEVPDENVIDVVSSKEITPPQSEESIITDALQNPMGTDRLSEMARPGDKVVIVVDDYTRPCPNEKLLQPVLKRLKKAGVPDSNITIIVANGTHSSPSFESIKEIVGDKIARNYTVISNDSENGDFVKVGVSKNGNDIEILRDYVESDIKIILGDIEYHYFAGFGGTRKSILPGIASGDTVQNNHSMLFHEKSETGVLKDNPVSEEMNEALHMVGYDFVFNVVLNSDHQIVGAWAGQPDPVMNAGVELVDNMYKVEVDEKPDIVVVSASGHPHDIDLYQSLKALHTTSKIVKKDGVVILVAKCPNNCGNELYLEWIQTHDDSKQIEKDLKENFVIGAHKAYYHYKAIEKHQVIMVSSMCHSDLEEVFKFKTSEDVNEALEEAFDIVGKDAKVLVLPQGTNTHVVHS